MCFFSQPIFSFELHSVIPTLKHCQILSHTHCHMLKNFHVHAFVFSRLDNCNALLIRTQKLQYIQNRAARILMKIRKYHTHPSLTPLASCLIQDHVQNLLTHPSGHPRKCLSLTQKATSLFNLVLLYSTSGLISQ